METATHVIYLLIFLHINRIRMMKDRNFIPEEKEKNRKVKKKKKCVPSSSSYTLTYIV